MEVPGAVLKQLLRKEISVVLDKGEEALVEPSIGLKERNVRWGKESESWESKSESYFKS